MHLTEDMLTLLKAHAAGATGALHGLADMMQEHDDPNHRFNGELLARALTDGEVSTHSVPWLPYLATVKRQPRDMLHPTEGRHSHTALALRFAVHPNMVTATAPVTSEDFETHKALRPTDPHHTAQDVFDQAPLEPWPGNPAPERLSRVAMTSSQNMQARLRAARQILAQAEVNATPLPVLAHNDATGYRPDVMVSSEEHVHPAVLRYLAAWHGRLHGAPNVVAFNAHEGGPDKVHVIHSGIPQVQAMDVLRQAGLPKFSTHKNVVYLFDPSGGYDVTPLLRSLNASQYHAIPGTGAVIGAGEGADATSQRAAYRDAVRAGESAAAESGPAAQVPAAAPLKMSRLVPGDQDANALVRPYAQLKPGKSRGFGGLHRLADLLHEKFPGHPATKWMPYIMTHPDLKVSHIRGPRRSKLTLEHTLYNGVRYHPISRAPYTELSHELRLHFGSHEWSFRVPVESRADVDEYNADHPDTAEYLKEAAERQWPTPVRMSRHTPAGIAAAYTPGIDPTPSTLTPDAGKQKETAAVYDALPHDPGHPDVKRAYGALAAEVKAQYKHLLKHGVKLEPWRNPGQPYATSDHMRADVAAGHLYYFPTGDEMDPTHPLAAVDTDTGVRYNDMFRAVHDYFGHTVHPHQFGPKGEIRAWEEHAKMFSPEARKALTTETHGQNSYVNFGPHAHLPATERPYATQKAALLPEDHWPKRLSRLGDAEWQYVATLSAHAPFPVVADKLEEEGWHADEETLRHLRDGHPNGVYVARKGNKVAARPIPEAVRRTPSRPAIPFTPPRARMKRLARTSLPLHGDQQALVTAYAASKGKKRRDLGPLAAVADWIHEQHHDQPVGQWVGHVVTHPQLKVKVRKTPHPDVPVREGAHYQLIRTLEATHPLGLRPNTMYHQVSFRTPGHTLYLHAPFTSRPEMREVLDSMGHQNPTMAEEWADIVGLPHEAPERMSRGADTASFDDRHIDPTDPLASGGETRSEALDRMRPLFASDEDHARYVWMSDPTLPHGMADDHALSENPHTGLLHLFHHSRIGSMERKAAAARAAGHTVHGVYHGPNDSAMVLTTRRNGIVFMEPIIGRISPHDTHEEATAAALKLLWPAPTPSHS